MVSPLAPFRAMTDAALVVALERAFVARDCRAEFLIRCEMCRRSGRKGDL